MAELLKVGDTIPAGVTFSYIPYTEDKGDITSCGIPINYDASKGLLPIRLLPFLPLFPDFNAAVNFLLTLYPALKSR